MNGEIVLFLMGALLTAVATAFVVIVLRSASQPSRSTAPQRSSSDSTSPGAPDIFAAGHVPTDKLILRGLQDLLTRGPDDAFVIFEDAATKRFVQFRRIAEGIELDFPVIDLEDDQRRRADDYFRRLGVPLAEVELRRGSIETYQLPLGSDAARGARIALELFTVVFQLPPDLKLYQSVD